ncbi:MAG: hypothetical protein M3Y73_02200 [Actinomycetota bacterium]|nr:hypothetical protein [Actinomycetota bacterium]
MVEHEGSQHVVDTAIAQRYPGDVPRTTAGGRLDRCQASMSGERSSATGRAPPFTSSALPNPVPAPTSSTSRPRNECGVRLTSSTASGWYTRRAPVAQPCAAPAYLSTAGCAVIGSPPLSRCGLV